MRATREQDARRRSLAIAAVMTLVVHASLGAGLHMAGALIEEEPPPPEPIEVEVIKPEPPKEREKPEEPEQEPEQEPEPPDEPPEPPPERAAKPKEPRKPPEEPEVRPEPAAEPPEPAEPDTEPAPGPNTNNDAPAPVVTLPSLTPGGEGPPAAVGKVRTRKVGTGGTGTNTGGGGSADSTGTGGPRPVSIASIKRRARPLNPDLDASELYPDEARRLGIEGQIKVALVVDKTGRVARRRLLTRLGHGLDELALKLAGRLRFEPAVDTSDRPVADKVVWTFTFVLPE